MCIYIPFVLVYRDTHLLSREFYSNASLPVTPFVVFTLRLFKISLNLKITTFKALSLCNLSISQQSWLADCLCGL